MTPRPPGAAIAVALVGAGEFGATFAAQARRIPGLDLRLVCDADPGRARRALAGAGYDPERTVPCPSRPAVLAALERGRLAVVEDWQLIADLPLDAVVEATGNPEVAAAVAELAIASGMAVGLVTKEAEIVVGPLLAHRARAAGVAHTPVDGDQPSLLIALVARARMLGLPVMAAGKSTESDHVFDPAAGTVTAWERSVAAPDYGRAFAAGDPRDALAARALPGLDRATAPDLCEMGIVANHCGLAPDVAALHAPVARTTELAQLFRPRGEGGLLGRAGVVDVFACLRRPDELSFAGGVFVVVEAPDPATGRLLAAKGIPGSGDGRHLMLHNPVHLLGVEAAASVLAAVRERRSTGGAEVRQGFDLVARASRALPAGTSLALGPRHVLPGADPLLVPARALAPDAPVPYYLAAGRRLARDVAAGAVLTLGDLEPDGEGVLFRLRREQDALFAGYGQAA